MSLDCPAPVRPGEELDAAALTRYLKDHLSAFEGPVEVEQFPSGYSNLTYLIRDLGTSLAYWVEADDPDELQALRFCLTHLPGTLTRRALVERYAAQAGRPIDDARVYYVYGLYKLAGIVQQIFYRYRQGHTDDPRFAGLNQTVRALGVAAERAIQRGV